MTLTLQGGCDRQNYRTIIANRPSTTRMVRRPRFPARRLYTNCALSIITQFYTVVFGRHTTERLRVTKQSMTQPQSLCDYRHSIAMGNIAAI
jgi:hypothetical protein